MSEDTILMNYRAKKMEDTIGRLKTRIGDLSISCIKGKNKNSIVWI